MVAIRCFVFLVRLKTQGPVNGRYIHRFDMKYSRLKGPWKLGTLRVDTLHLQGEELLLKAVQALLRPRRCFWFSIGTENRVPRTQTADGWGLNQKGSNCDRNPKLNLRTFSGNQKGKNSDLTSCFDDPRAELWVLSWCWCDLLRVWPFDPGDLLSTESKNLRIATTVILKRWQNGKKDEQRIYIYIPVQITHSWASSC